MTWATRITSLSMELVVPALLGLWADQKWGTTPWLLILGACLGLLVAGTHFVQLARVLAGEGSNRRSRSNH